MFGKFVYWGEFLLGCAFLGGAVYAFCMTLSVLTSIIWRIAVAPLVIAGIAIIMHAFGGLTQLDNSELCNEQAKKGIEHQF